MVTARVGWVAVVVAGLVGQALVVFSAIWLVPGITSTFWSAFLASWIVAGVGTGAAWIGSAGTDDAFAAVLLRQGGTDEPLVDPDIDGVVFVQLDGVSFPVLQWAIQAGAVPTMRRWVTSGAYLLREWTAQLPSTTPASQLGILHGTLAGVPAFRWYDRALGRVLIANRPGDAEVIERRVANGTGLLADDGFGLGNLFTGDASRVMLTVSRAGVVRDSATARRSLGRFLVNPHGFARGLVRTIAELAKERWQAARQDRLDIVPRVHRGWTFACLRAATNVLQRDLNTAVIADEMRKGTKSIYVDYVDYDEIAHHAGIFRPESLAALDGLDRVLGTLERLAAHAPRRYHIVVLSDHGQSQGQTFRDRTGNELGDLCTRLMDQGVASLDTPVEGWGRIRSLAQGLASTHLAGRVEQISIRRLDEGAGAADSKGVSILGSGNLGLLYVHSPVRLSLDDLEARWPRLLPGLCAEDEIGFVAGLDDDHVPWAIGATGRVRLDTGAVSGESPLEPYGPHASRVVRQAVLMAEAPDLYINSTVDDITLDVAAFEPLVGAHGGLGGWQDRAVLLTPRAQAHVLPAKQIEGADRLHDVLVAMLRSVGQRQRMPDDEIAPTTTPSPGSTP
jgi:hypothetical protein